MVDKGKGIADVSLSGKRKRNGHDKSDYRKRKNSVLQFFEESTFEIEESGSSDEDDIINDVFLEDDDYGPDFEVKVEPKTPNIPFFPKLEDMDEEELDKMLEERYKPSSNFVKYSEDQPEATRPDDRHTHMSFVKDPKKMLEVRYKPGSNFVKYSEDQPEATRPDDRHTHMSFVKDPKKMLEVRYKPGSNFVKYSEDQPEATRPDDRHTHMSFVKDPTIWKVKCVGGKSGASFLGTDGGGQPIGRSEAVDFTGLAEASFMEKLRSGAQELGGLMDEAASRCLGRASAEDQFRSALMELESCKKRVSAVEAERDTLSKSLHQERAKIISAFGKLLNTEFHLVTRMKK